MWGAIVRFAEDVMSAKEEVVLDRQWDEGLGPSRRRRAEERAALVRPTEFFYCIIFFFILNNI